MREPPRDACGTSSSVSFDISYSLNGEKHSIFGSEEFIYGAGKYVIASVDYPDMAQKAVEEFRKGDYEFGVLLCGTGIGISISANKMNGVRCALPQNCYAATMAKQHNNANFIAFGGRIEYGEDPISILDAFISSEFEGGRHQRRIDKIMALEGK